MTQDRRLRPPAFPRNRDPILAVLRALWPEARRPVEVLELASGRGERACDLALRLPHTTWQPSAQRPAALASINSRRAALDCGRVRPAIRLDVIEGPWPEARFDAVVAFDLLHMIGHDEAARAVRGAGGALRPGGHLVVFDRFTFNGAHLSEASARLDAHLRASTPAGRLHAIEPLDAAARAAGLGGRIVHHLPADDQLVVWRREAAP